MRFRSSFPPMPDSFVLIFRLFDVLVCMLLLFALISCLLAAFIGVVPPSLLSPFFSLGFLLAASYFALMIYGFSLDFRSGGFDKLEIDDDFASFLLRKNVLKVIRLDSISSVKLVKIRLFLSYAYYAVISSPRAKAVAEVSEKDFAELRGLLPGIGLKKKDGRSLPLFVSTDLFQR